MAAKIDVEPSGEPFNEISLDPVTERPRNPMINAGAIVDHNAHLGRGVHVAPGGIVKASAEVADFGKVDSGEIVRSPWENQ